MKILIVKLNAIGDVLFATPLVAALRERFPEAEIDWLIGRHAEPILRGHPAVHDRIVFDGPYGNALLFPAQLSHTLIALRQRRYDRVYVLHRSLLAQLIAGATGARLRVGFEGRLARLALSHTVPFDPTAHETERYLELLRATEGEVANPGMQLGLTYESQVVGELWLREAGARTPLLGLVPGGGRNPGTEMLIKRWPAERFRDLGRRLLDATGGTLAVFGTPDEAELCEEVLDGLEAPDALNFCGRTSLPQLAALLARCDVVVANDSGPLHIAAAAGTPTVALFGPTDPRLVAPLGELHRHFWQPPDCGPCYRPDNARDHAVWTCAREGDELRCLRDVDVDAVADAALDLLARAPARPAPCMPALAPVEIDVDEMEIVDPEAEGGQADAAAARDDDDPPCADG